MMLETDRKILVKENARVDKVINTLSKKLKRKFVKDELLDVARDIKSIIANLLRSIDGC